MGGGCQRHVDQEQTGSPQGSVVSPLLANTYLHYAFDLWVDVWRKKCAQGGRFMGIQIGWFHLLVVTGAIGREEISENNFSASWA
jgi:hypothetical protein